LTSINGNVIVADFSDQVSGWISHSESKHR